VIQDRYEDLIATGFALLFLGGTDENQADDFIRDGYRGWRESPPVDDERAAALLADLIAVVGDRDYALTSWAKDRRTNSLDCMATVTKPHIKLLNRRFETLESMHVNIEDRPPDTKPARTETPCDYLEWREEPVG